VSDLEKLLEWAKKKLALYAALTKGDADEARNFRFTPRKELEALGVSLRKKAMQSGGLHLTCQPAKI
jgi:hypothetical protein